jgi:hypothetical protein
MRLPLLVVLSAWLAACGPRNYDQCVLENVNEGMDEVAVRAVLRACQNEFPKRGKPAEGADLPAESLAQLSGDGSIMYDNRFGGSIYNGSDYTLTQVEIAVESLEEDSLVIRTYLVPVQIDPKTTGTFSFDVLSCEKRAEVSSHDQLDEFGDHVVWQDIIIGECDWSVVNAKGTR